MHRLAVITDGMILFVYECLEIEKDLYYTYLNMLGNSCT